MTKSLFRKTLSAPGLLRLARGCFERVPDPVAGRGLTLPDCLMSALAMFGLKYSSLLRFDRDARSCERIRSNLRSLYGVSRAPSDTAMRERLDEVDPAAAARGRDENGGLEPVPRPKEKAPDNFAFVGGFVGSGGRI